MLLSSLWKVSTKADMFSQGLLEQITITFSFRLTKHVFHHYSVFRQLDTTDISDIFPPSSISFEDPQVLTSLPCSNFTWLCF